MPTVLVVDDEPGVRELVAALLREAGFSVTTAANGSDAISVFRTHEGRFNLLISDVMMPGVDGPALVEELRAASPDLPVILMSGACEPSRLRTRKPVMFLAKPFSLKALLSHVQRASREQPAVTAGASSQLGQREVA